MTGGVVLVVAGLAAAAAYLPLAGKPPGVTRSVLKTLPLTAFAMAAFVTGGSPFLVAAFALSALGDLALSRDGRAAFLYGLSAFGLAHLLFVLTFLGVSGLPVWEAFVTAPLLAAALILLALSTEVWLAPHTGALRWPVRAYVVLITAMGLACLTLPDGLAMARLGVLLFIASDLILSVRLFRLPDTHAAALPASRTLWGLYIAGQALILIAFATP